MFGSTDFTLFGVSWILAGSILVALVLRYWAKAPEEGVKLFAAFWMVGGFIINKVYVEPTWQWPITPEGWIGLALQALIFFGSVMGLAPGETARKVAYKAKAAILGR